MLEWGRAPQTTLLGPGGGGTVTQTPPGATSIFQFTAMKPGVFIYHCATPMIPYHLSHGMYGLMVVEPPGGWPKVDREFYVMQGDIYLKGDRTQIGVHDPAVDKMENETPDFVVFNGSAGSLSRERALKAKVGETARIFFGNAGPNMVSSFHVIGEIFDKVHPEGATETLSNVQSTLVPAGGATRCRMHGGAAGSGAPKGKRNGKYRHGGFTTEAIDERRRLASLIRDSRDFLSRLR